MRPNQDNEKHPIITFVDNRPITIHKDIKNKNFFVVTEFSTSKLTVYNRQINCIQTKNVIVLFFS